MMNSVFRLAHVSEEESSEFQEDEDESHDGDIAAKEATKSQDVEASHSAERLDPQTQLRQTLINEGFAERDIDGALGKMWDRQLPYDDCNAVRDFLREENVDGFVKGQCPPEEETKTTSTADSTSGTTTNPSDRDDENRPPSTESEANAERQSLGSAKDNRTKDDSQQKPKKSIGHSLDIGSKLELVADYENLTDAAFALSEWVAKAADAAEIEELCEAQKTRALLTVMRRCIADIRDESKFAESILPSVLHLVGSIFLNVGMSSNAVSATRKNLDAVLQQARTACLLKVDPEQDFAESTARHVVGRIAQSIRDLKFSSNDGGDLIIRLEHEIESISSSLVTPRQGGIVDLIRKRDSGKLAVEKSAALVSLVLGTNVRGFDSDSKSSVDEAVAPREEIVQALMGAGGLRRMESNKRNRDHLRTRAATLESSESDLSTTLRSKLRTYQAERRLVADRMEELRRAMQQLEEDDRELREKIAEAESQLSNINAQSTEETGRLRGELAATEDRVKFDDSVDCLVDKLRTYDDSLKKAVAVSGIVESCEDLDEMISSKLGVYLVNVSSYFSSEVECVEFLRNRIETLEREVKGLRREIGEYEALGIHTTVSHLNESLSTAQQNIVDDNRVVEGLLTEAQMMLDAVHRKLEQFTSKQGSWQLRQLSPLHATMLRSIATSVEQMELGSTDFRTQWIPKSGLPIIVTTSRDEMDASLQVDSSADGGYSFQGTAEMEEEDDDDDDVVVEDAGEDQEGKGGSRSEMELTGEPSRTSAQPRETVSDESVATEKYRKAEPSRAASALHASLKEDSLTPKLRWANSSEPTKRPTVKSLVEIQREEEERLTKIGT